LIAKDAKGATDLLYGGQVFQPSGEAIVLCRVNADGAIADDDT
jgi:hypothetical protein